ncbi:hypothetical protein F2Q69_00014688 [Brassica cretica]|uniref:Uncharacterized protein n=1 Tax=Brassica cretica TaxID=69181 RepID=A0A8S9QTY9_BRACR|nr:hypothetical protein F2Q69_00014688 [Brassica cretica]
MSSDADAERRERRRKRRYDEASTSIQHRDPWPRDEKTPIETFSEIADPKKADLHPRALPHLRFQGGCSCEQDSTLPRPQRILGDNRHGDVELQLRYADRHPSPHPPVDRLRFMPDSHLLRDLPAIPRRSPGVRRARATQGPPEAPLPDFPIIPDIPMRDQGDFQRVVVDALSAIWARVSCSSRRTIRAHSPAAAGPCRQRRDPSSESNDETSEDTD